MKADIIDVCCGYRHFHADKNNPNVLFCDNRESVNPQIVSDFTNLEFESETFSLVIFDPPHIKNNRGSEKSFMVQKYGKLPQDYKECLTQGFKECMRVLKPKGTLIFKWSEAQISLASILECFPQTPIIMQKSSKTAHFIVFFKELV